MPSRLRPTIPARLDSVFAVAAVVLVLLLPVTALTAPARDMTWSALDLNLVYVRSAPGSVTVNSTGMQFHVSDAANSSLVNLASLSSDTVVDLSGQFSVAPGALPRFFVRFTNPYDRASCAVSFDAAQNKLDLESTNSSGALVSSGTVSGFVASSPFDVRAEFVPGQAFTFQMSQSGRSRGFTCFNLPLASLVPVNLDLELLTSLRSASVTLTSLQLTLPATTNRQFEASSAPLALQYVAIGALSIAAFRRPLLRTLRVISTASRRLRGRGRRFYTAHRVLLLATIFAVPIQVAITLLGSHPYDIFTQELWSYIAPHYGTVSIIPMSLLVPGGKSVGLVSPIGSFYPYPPLSLYLFAGIGFFGEILAPAAPIPSLLYADLVKFVWLGFLDAAAWVVYLELGRLGVSGRGRLGIFLLVLLNPGLLMDLAVWGQFEIVVAFFLLISFVAYGRQRVGYALFFLLLAVLTKQTALFVAAFLLPAYLATWGLRRVAIALGRCLLGVFFLLLPLFALGLSPTYVVRVTVGDVIFSAVLPAAAGVAPWQQTVTNGAFNLWPLLTALLNGQTGLQRLGYPDFVPSPVLGVPYSLLGAGLAAVGFVVIVLETEHARRRGRLEYGTALLIGLSGFLWVFTVMTRMSARYLALVVPLMALLWWAPDHKRLARILFGLTTIVLTLSLLAQLGVTAVELPPALDVFRSSSILAFSNDFVTWLSVSEVAVLLISLAALWRSAGNREFPSTRSYPPRADLPPLPDLPRVSVIILNYNGGDLAWRCVTSVLADSYPNKEVLVVDNASTDRSLDLLAEFAAAGRIALLRNSANLSFAGGNNRGAEHATGELLLFLNNDTEVEPGAIEKLVAKFRNDPTLGAAQPLVLFLPARHLMNSAGNLLDTLAFNEILGLAQPREGFAPSEKTSYAVGAAHMIRRELFSRVGGFDEVLDFYYTDADLSWKTWLAGFRVCVVPEAIVYHAEGSALKMFGSLRRLQMVIRTQLTVVAKNYEAPRAIGACVSIVGLYLGVATMYLLRGDLRVARAMVTAIGSFVASLPEIVKGRGGVARLRTISDESARREFLVPFNPIVVFLRKREGWGYLSDRETDRLG